MTLLQSIKMYLNCLTQPLLSQETKELMMIDLTHLSQARMHSISCQIVLQFWLKLIEEPSAAIVTFNVKYSAVMPIAKCLKNNSRYIPEGLDLYCYWHIFIGARWGIFHDRYIHIYIYIWIYTNICMIIYIYGQPLHPRGSWLVLLMACFHWVVGLSPQSWVV